MRTRLFAAFAAVLLAGAAVPVTAQTTQVRQPVRQPVRQFIQFGAGLFMPRGLDSRVEDDVLVRNIAGEPMPANSSVTDALAFEIGDFRSAFVFGEWTIGVAPQVEVGVSVGAYGRTVPTFYLDVVDDATDEDIELDLNLRILPVSGIVRFLPFSRPGEVQVFVGGGVSLLNFRYREVGDFVDPFTLNVSTEEFEGSGTALGVLVLGGVRVPIARGAYALSFEGRYQFGTGDLGVDDSDDASNEFLTETIDLSGGLLTAAFSIRF